MIRPYRGILPRIAVSAYVDPSAQVIGDVEIGERASVWPNVTIRGDVNYIRIGDETNVQDNSCFHVDRTHYPLNVGKRVTVGHSVTLHGCTVDDEALIGMGAVVLNGAHIGKGAIVAAGALIPEGMEVPPDSVAMGVPAKVRRQVTDAEKTYTRGGVESYMRLAAEYKEESN